MYRDSVYVMPGLFSEWPAARVKKTKTAERLAAAMRDDSITRNMYNFVSNPMRLWEGAFIHPTSNLRIKDTYGTLRETFTNAPPRYHYGIDYAPKVVGTIGDSIFSENDGVVVRVGYDQYTYGKYCIVDHGGGLVLSYYHTDTVLVAPGDCVKRGQLIALMGATGEGITGPHLHVGARLHGVAINPFAVMSMSERYFHNENFIEPVSVR